VLPTFRKILTRIQSARRAPIALAEDSSDRLSRNSTFAFPEFAMPAVAKAAIERIQEARA
jgi:hypothetical protein